MTGIMTAETILFRLETINGHMNATLEDFEILKGQAAANIAAHVTPQISGELVYPCPICGIKYPCNRMLARHMVGAHPAEELISLLNCEG